jgi:enoyl-CoA hydratase
MPSAKGKRIMTESCETLKIEVADYVATVRLARAPVNAQNRRFREEMIALFDGLSDRADVRAVVLTGEGKTFSAGADLKERPRLETAGAYPNHNRLVRESFNAVMECEKPVIAAVNGAAIGAGCVLALCCDVIIVSENAYFAMAEVDVGLAGGVSHVRRFFRESDARLLIYTARRVHGPELYRMGVASACVPANALLSTCHEIAREIAGKSPLAVRAAKRSFNVTEGMALRDAYRFEQSQTVTLASSEETKEAQRAFAEKRKPVFR